MGVFFLFFWGGELVLFEGGVENTKCSEPFFRGGGSGQFFIFFGGGGVSLRP